MFWRCWMVIGKAHVAGWLKLRVCLFYSNLHLGIYSLLYIYPMCAVHSLSAVWHAKPVPLTLASHNMLLGLFYLTPKWILIGMLSCIAILRLPTIWHARRGQGVL